METKSLGLERPLVVQLAAAVLIATPVMDILSGHRSGSYLFDALSWLLIFGAGASLMVRHKSSWLLGIVLCVLFVIYNLFTIIQSMQPGGNPVAQTARLLDCLLVAFIIGSVFYFFRYPYLDRRQHWFAPTGSRFAAQTPVVLNGAFQTNSLDLSYTGARIALPQGNAGVGGFKKGDRVSLLLSEINDLLFQAKVLEVQESYIRVHFEGASAQEQELIRQWLSSQNLPKA
ncbi:PilZ domain-containing protein [Bdellovibrio svalbardensis]|uniref:PilZ domain-containing protein n=1 Tax=Bdellovibrio svalbardensis TaxID=2972972 RepID=A0ABT6DHW3_9BACT|nr:PilZ domain-containing protein [Bdellovibrio svalbardensis]MDG0816062.1 PilZ domain-containing protein [Bdellovibrio svalbardensis]